MIILKHYSNPLFFTILFLITGFLSVSAQQVQLKGVIQDSVQNPLQNTNVIATPKGKTDASTEFSISDLKGRYKLNLEKGQKYILEINQLGYAKVRDSIVLKKDRTKNFTLFQSTESLNEVDIESEMAVVVSGDTTTYRTDQFKTGEERKLREVLEKLPGVEVDRDGNVKVNGKKVTKLMVDGKDFFGGDTKLGVNNIPADAVDEVEALDNYNEVAFMKGLSDSDKMALNIKLKEDKKNFVFGETEAGGGVKDRYNIHPTLFYYSAKTTVNLIGSFNNTGKAPLDYDDVNRFRGGYSSFLNDPIDSGNDGLYQFSGNSDIRYQKTDFGAANITQQITPELRLNAYSIAAKKKTRRLSEQDITYLTQDDLEEQRENSSKNKGFSSISKLKLRYKPNAKTDISYDAVITAENSSYLDQVTSQIADSTNRTRTAQDPHNLKVAQYFRYNSQPEYEHTWELTGNYIYQDRHHTTNWLFDRPVFADFIPAENDSESFNFLHDYASTTNKFRINLKHYWVVNNFNHIYPKAGVYFFNQNYNSTDYQRLQNGNRNSFRPAGFDNALDYQLVDPYFGFQYKFKAGDFLVKPGLVYHHYFWKADQFGENITDKNKGVLLPELHAEYEFTGSENIELDYNLRSQFQDASKYANRLRLVSFNQLYRGNEDLENSLYHKATLGYRKFDMYHGLTFYTSLNYTHREKSVRNITQLEGINRVSTTVYTDFPENSYGFSGRISKRMGDYRLSFSGSANLSDYSRIINTEKIDYTSQNYRYKIQGRTDFDDFPNLTLGLSQSFSTSKSEQFNTNFLSANPFARLRYDFWDGFILKMDYDYTYYENQSRGQINRFEIGNASLYYSAENSPWGFEVRADNVFDVKYKNSNSFSQYMVYDQRIYIQPRTALFILSYQL